MAFHPERLTGRRRRRWEASLNWAPAMPVADIPKVLVARLKKPHEVRAFARVNVGETPVDPLSKAGRHYVVIVRNRVVTVDHPHAPTFELLRAVTDAADWTQHCYCHAVREKWATAARPDNAPYDERRKRHLGYAVREADMPPAFVPLAFKRRPPVGRHRLGFKWGQTSEPDEARHPAPYAAPERAERVKNVVVARLARELERRIDAWLREHRLKFRPTVVRHLYGGEDNLCSANAVGEARYRTYQTRDLELVWEDKAAAPSVVLEVNAVLWWVRLGRLGVCAPGLFPLEVSPTSDRRTLVGVALDAAALGAEARAVPRPKSTKCFTHAVRTALTGVVLTGTPGTPYAAAKFAWTDYRRGAGSDVNLDHLTDVVTDTATGEVSAPACTHLSPTRHPDAAVHPPGALTRLHPWPQKTASSAAG